MEDKHGARSNISIGYKIKSMTFSFFTFLGISILSALPIALIGVSGKSMQDSFFRATSNSDGGFGLLGPLFLVFFGPIILQIGLIVPTALWVVWVSTRLSEYLEMYQIHPVIQVMISLALNSIAASSVFIIAYFANTR